MEKTIDDVTQDDVWTAGFGMWSFTSALKKTLVNMLFTNAQVKAKVDQVFQFDHVEVPTRSARMVPSTCCSMRTGGFCTLDEWFPHSSAATFNIFALFSNLGMVKNVGRTYLKTRYAQAQV